MMTNNLPHNAELQEAIAKIPSGQRYFTGPNKIPVTEFDNHPNCCVFGYGSYGSPPINHIPAETIGLSFYYGGGIKNLLEEILKLPIVDKLERLTIGITHNNVKDYADYSAISKLLSDTYLPKLRFLEYGVDELIVNESCIYGNLGDITGALKNMPCLEKLYLYGNFELTEPVKLPHLTNLEVQVDDWGTHINGGKVTSDTLQHLLSSRLESLVLMSLDLNFPDKNFDYSLPEIFLSAETMPKLKTVEIMGKFKRGTTSQSKSSQLFSNLKDNLDIKRIQEPVL